MILSTHLFCLLNLSTTPQLFSPLLLAYTFDVLNLIRQHNQPNTIRYLLCMIYYALCTMHYVLYIIYYTLCTMHYTLCTMHYSLCTMHYALCSIHYALYTMHYLLCTIYYALCTMYYALCTCIYTYSYIFTILYQFIRIHTYLLFHMDIRRNPVILVHTRSSRRVE